MGEYRLERGGGKVEGNSLDIGKKEKEEGREG